jgi:cysteine desulfurase
VREEVVEAITRVLRDCPGNPSSVHAEGSAARAQLERARARVASLIGVEPEDVLFTGGATEANNTALCCAGAGGRGGVAGRRAGGGGH